MPFSQMHDAFQRVLMCQTLPSLRRLPSSGAGSIEARGIAQFQTIVSEGISPALLQWKGIEATEKLASSTNAKMVVMGNGKDSLPVLLGAGEYGGAGGGPASAAAGAAAPTKVAVATSAELAKEESD